jgi:hypothetical protein
MPAWRQGQTVGEWRQISGTALASAPISVKTYPTLSVEGPEAKVTSWNGFAIDTRDSSVYSVANGGHWAYAGNEINRIKLLDNAPSWGEQRAATPASQVVESVSHYADGRPTSRHTYYGTMINEARNRAMLLSGSRYGNGWVISTVDGFDLAANDWDKAKSYPDMPSAVGGIPGVAMTLNRATGEVYAFGYFDAYRWSPSSNSWSTRLSGTAFNGQYAASALDTKRNRILLLGGDASIKAIYDLNNNTMQVATLSGADAGSLNGSGNGMVYDPLQDAFLLRKPGAGATVYRINAGTLAVDQMPTGSTGTQIPSAINGVWTRFLYVPALKGVVYYPSYSGNVWFQRTN